MDDRSDDEPSDNVLGDGSDDKIIVDGLFGVANEENTNEMHSDDSSQSDEIQMEVEYDSKINQAKLTQNVPIHSGFSEEIQMKTSTNTSINNVKFSEENDQINSKLSEIENCIILKDSSPINEKNDFCSTVDADSNNFGNHVLCSNSTDPDKSEIQPSFALISENYEKSRKDDVTKTGVKSLENQTICDQASKSNAKSVVVLPKGSFPSTLSMISANYQDSSSEDSDSSVSSLNKIVDSDDENSIISVLKDEPIRTRGELDISELPPIKDLKITVEEEKCQPVGCIKSIVKTLVVVEAFLNQPALDIDSVLFVDRGQRALGRIFDVFGPVNKPYYAVRFNDNEHIKKFDVQIKEPVYCAPQTEYASFVLVSQLMAIKGSDASWRHNNEPPCEFLDYSDDEAEKLAKKKRKQKKREGPEENDSIKKEKLPSSPAQNITKKNVKPTASASSSSARNPNRPPIIRPQIHTNTYSPHPPNVYVPCPPNYSYGPRQFPTYAQHLSSMDYSHTYRQPYNPYGYDQMYPPRHVFPYQRPYRPPGYDYRPQQPMDPDNPNQFHQPDYDYM